MVLTEKGKQARGKRAGTAKTELGKADLELAPGKSNVRAALATGLIALREGIV